MQERTERRKEANSEAQKDIQSRVSTATNNITLWEHHREDILLFCESLCQLKLSPLAPQMEFHNENTLKMKYAEPGHLVLSRIYGFLYTLYLLLYLQEGAAYGLFFHTSPQDGCLRNQHQPRSRSSLGNHRSAASSCTPGPTGRQALIITKGHRGEKHSLIFALTEKATQDLIYFSETLVVF